MNNLNINSLFNLTSAAVVVFGYLWASLANNKRMDEFGKRMELMQDRLLAEIRSVRVEVQATREILSGRMDGLEQRIGRIERQLEHPVVRP